MQHTLLPFNERRALRKEYRIRALIVLLFIMSIATLIGAVAFLPAFTKASEEDRSVENQIAALKKGKVTGGSVTVEAELASDGALLSTLKNVVGTASLSTVIGNLSAARGPIQLTTISISRSDPSTIAISLQGKAPTRDDLLAFKKRLESQVGTTVDLPISELARSMNIQFSVHIIEPLP